MNYQGRLTDMNGNAVTALTATLTFNIYDASSGGTRHWGPFSVNADLIDGRFNVLLGPNDTSNRPIANAFNGGGNRYIRVTVAGSGNLPRQQIFAAPTAFHAKNADLAAQATNATNADHATTADTAANFTSNVLFTDESARLVGIGDATPSGRFSIKAPSSGGSTDPDGGLRLEEDDNTTAWRMFYDTANDNLTFRYSNHNSDTIRVKKDGEVDFVAPGSASGTLRISSPGGDPGFSVTPDGGGTPHALSFEDGGIAINPRGGSTELFVHDNGNVGIGVTSPTRSLSIEAQGSTPVLRLKDTSQYSNYWWDFETHNGHLDLRAGGGGTGRFNWSSGSYTATSDRTLKKEIEELPPSLERLLKLKPVSYLFKSQPSGAPVNLGFIAQDVQLLFPEIVEELSGGKLGLTHDEFIPVAVASIQELKAEKDSEIQSLREANAALMKRLENLERLIGDQKN